ncbi:MAG: C4-dicarboxylate ABC transporter substrate-binding protein, partial [Ramlibacter sp.]|nr:C4-dicarboxylate ABC transporter substrate-binding protein [Ramlibacter sp.]
MKIWLIAAMFAAGAAHAQNSQNNAVQLKIEVNPNNTLFKLNDIRAAVQDGKVEAGETIMSSMVKDVPIA